MAQRIKGQEVQVIFVENNSPLTNIVDARSVEMEAQLEIMSEGYLGETTNRRDSVYRGFSGRVELHFENRDVIDLVRRLIDKARRRTAGTRINMQMTMVFPDGGDRVRVLLKNLEFGAIPLGFGSRSEYGTITLPFEGEDYAVI